jgi:hypothetical protein
VHEGGRENPGQGEGPDELGRHASWASLPLNSRVRRQACSQVPGRMRTPAEGHIQRHRPTRRADWTPPRTCKRQVGQWRGLGSDGGHGEPLGGCGGRRWRERDIRPYRTRMVREPVAHISRSSTLEVRPGLSTSPGTGTTPAIWPFSTTTVRCPRRDWLSLWTARGGRPRQMRAG